MAGGIEAWKPVVGLENLYEVSDHGRVRNSRTGRVLRPDTSGTKSNGGGYARVVLCGKTRRVHDLALRAFVGPPPKGMECRHLDGDRQNNLLSNLRWGTRKQNRQDSIRYGGITSYTGGLAKLTANQVREIKALLGKVPQREIGAAYGITQPTVSAIATGATWRGV